MFLAHTHAAVVLSVPFLLFYASPESKTKSAFNCSQVRLACTCCPENTPALAAQKTRLHFLPRKHACTYCPENTPALTAQKTRLHLLPRKHAGTYCPENTPALTAQKTHHAKTCRWSASRDAGPCLACPASGPRRCGMQLVEQPGRSQAHWAWYPWASRSQVR